MVNNCLKPWDMTMIESLPNEESEYYEYKSSATPFERLQGKISIAASAFWNSGGGVFIAGVNDNGEIDGGIPNSKGRQKIRDWVDAAIMWTQPLGKYHVHVIPIDESNPDSKIVLVIDFIESVNVPHMAYDHKYYIRAGAHSVSANHFMVESLRALRQFIKPQLKAIMKVDKRKQPNIESVMIASVNDAPAIDVSITFNPFPTVFEEHFKEYFPLKVALIDKNNPFELDVSIFGIRDQVFGENPAKIMLCYKDVLGNAYNTDQEIHPEKNLPPTFIGEDIFVSLSKAINALTDTISRRR